MMSNFIVVGIWLLCDQEKQLIFGSPLYNFAMESLEYATEQ